MVNALLLVQSHLLASSIVARREANTIVSIVEYPLPERAMCHRQEIYAKIFRYTVRLWAIASLPYYDCFDSFFFL